MGYKQARGVLTDPSKKSNTEPAKPKKSNAEPAKPKRANSDIKTEDRPKGSGRSYSKEKNATLSTTGAIPESMRGQKFISNNKIYVAGASNAPKTGRLLKSN